MQAGISTVQRRRCQSPAHALFTPPLCCACASAARAPRPLFSCTCTDAQCMLATHPSVHCLADHILPPLPALLPRARAHMVGHLPPLVRAVQLHSLCTCTQDGKCLGSACSLGLLCSEPCSPWVSSFN